jgi:3-oxoacyl-(acyl-carrier-protein) synthase
MNTFAKILAIGVVDSVGIDGTNGTHVTWQELGVEAPGTTSTLRTVFDKADPTYRRLDHQCRALVLAAEACGVDAVLSPEQRHDAALFTETCLGSIEVDLRYTQSLGSDMVEAAIFPYTLPSTCLGEVALRHGLRGPSNCFSVETSQTGESLREALRLLRDREVEHAVVGIVDVLGQPVPTLEPAMRAVVVILASKDDARPAIAAWPDDPTDPFGALARICRQP